MKRVCADYQINFTFMKSKSKCTYTVFGGSKTFDLSIKTRDYLILSKFTYVI